MTTIFIISSIWRRGGATTTTTTTTTIMLSWVWDWRRGRETLRREREKRVVLFMLRREVNLNLHVAPLCVFVCAKPLNSKKKKKMMLSLFFVSFFLLLSGMDVCENVSNLKKSKKETSIEISIGIIVKRREPRTNTQIPSTIKIASHLSPFIVRFKSLSLQCMNVESTFMHWMNEFVLLFLENKNKFKFFKMFLKPKFKLN